MKVMRLDRTAWEIFLSDDAEKRRAARSIPSKRKPNSSTDVRRRNQQSHRAEGHDAGSRACIPGYGSSATKISIRRPILSARSISTSREIFHSLRSARIADELRVEAVDKEDARHDQRRSRAAMRH